MVKKNTHAHEKWKKRIHMHMRKTTYNYTSLVFTRNGQPNWVIIISFENNLDPSAEFVTCAYTANTSKM